MNSQRLLHLRVFQAEILVAQQFQDARGDVGAFGVEHGVVIGKGDLFQDALGAILVERRPAAVFALESQHPIQAALEAPRRAAPGLAVGILRKASRTIAVSSTSGFHLLLNSKTQPLGSTSVGFL